MWARQSYRLSDYDFKAASRDGFGDDWPLGYEELAPYYDRVERFIGISGRAEGLPQLPDGEFLPPMALTCGEEILKKAVADRFGRTLTIGRAAVLTRALNGRPACHYCGPCGRGCRTGSYYSSPHSTLPAAAATGRLTLIPDAVASHVTTDAEGRCTGVWYRGPPDAQSPRGGRQRRRPVRLDAGVDAHHAQLHVEPAPQRDRQRQRRARGTT